MREELKKAEDENRMIMSTNDLLQPLRQDLAAVLSRLGAGMSRSEPVRSTHGKSL